MRPVFVIPDVFDAAPDLGGRPLGNVIVSPAGPIGASSAAAFYGQNADDLCRSLAGAIVPLQTGRRKLMHTVATISASALLLVGCGQAGDTNKKTEANGPVAEKGPSCPLISASDVSAVYGISLSDAPANSLPQAQSCEFRGSGDTVVRIQVVPARYYEEHGGQDFRNVPGLGDKASISFELGGWRAMARQGDKAVAVTADGPEAKQENTLAVLKTSLAKI